MEDNVTAILTGIISIVALVYSTKSFYLTKRLDTENILYQEKIQSYKEVLTTLNDLLNTIQRSFATLNPMIIGKEEMDKDFIEELAGEIDDKTDLLDNIIISNSIIFSEKTIEKLEEIVDLLYQEPALDTLNSNTTKSYNESIDRLLKKAEEIYTAIRADLNTEDINLTLFKRIQNIR